MQPILSNSRKSIQRCLLALVAIALLPSHGTGQDRYRWSEDGWLYAWQNQPSGEFAPDYRRVDPLKPLASDADLEAHEARKSASFLAHFAAHTKAHASEETGVRLISAGPGNNESGGFSPLPQDSPAPGLIEPAGDYSQMSEVFPEFEPHTPQGVFSNSQPQSGNCVAWQVLPKGLMYKSYIAGEKEPRMQFSQLYDTRSNRRVWETALGGRLGLLRHGSCDSVNPEGFQLDLEGAVFARVLPDEPSAMLEGADFRAGLLGTNRYDGTAFKYGYYHISSHLGDEFLIANPTFNRLNYVRDSLIAGITQDLRYSTQVYGEIAYALGSQGGAEPWECQFGAQYLPEAKSSLRGAPYLAANYHIRQEFGARGGFNTIAGWGWQGLETRHRVRLGMQYYNGPSLQYQFFDRIENMYGGGIWYDY